MPVVFRVVGLIRPLVPVLGLGAVALLATPGLAAAADGAPQVGYGRFASLIETVRPYVATLFVTMGALAIIMRVGRGLARSISGAPDAPIANQTMPAVGAFVFQTVVAVVIVIVVLYAGLDLINGILAVIWSAAGSQPPLPSEVVPIATPIPSPPIMVAP